MNRALRIHAYGGPEAVSIDPRVPQIAELRAGKALFCLGSARFNGTRDTGSKYSLKGIFLRS